METSVRKRTLKTYNVRFFLQYQGGGKSGSEFFEVVAFTAGEAINKVKKQARDEVWYDRHDGSAQFSAVRL
jgi:hypothetical protein